ncbi:MAG: hypothetical protein WCP55_23490 [Lentisphaerota bacterium]
MQKEQDGIAKDIRGSRAAEKILTVPPPELPMPQISGIVDYCGSFDLPVQHAFDIQRRPSMTEQFLGGPPIQSGFVPGRIADFPYS